MCVVHTNKSLYIIVHIYIYREREYIQDVWIYMNTQICIHISIIFRRICIYTHMPSKSVRVIKDEDAKVSLQKTEEKTQTQLKVKVMQQKTKTQKLKDAEVKLSLFLAPGQ